MAISLHYYFSEKLILQTKTEQFKSTSQQIADHITRINQRVDNTLSVMIHDNRLFSGNFDENNSLRNILIEVLNKHPDFHSLLLGYANGDFIEVVNLRGHAQLPKPNDLRAEDRWLIFKVLGQGESRHQTTYYLDENLSLNRKYKQTPDYDPRKRLWFNDAKVGTVTKTQQYIFNLLKIPGYTYTIKSEQTGGVLAIDVASSSLSAFLIKQQQKMQFLVSSEMYVYRGDGEIIAKSKTQGHHHSFDDLSKIIKTNEQTIGLANGQHQFGKMLSVNEDGVEKYMFVLQLPLSSEMQSDEIDYFAVLVAKNDVLAIIKEKIQISILVTGLCLLLLLPVSWFFASSIVNPILKLVGENKKIQQRDYNEVSTLSSHILEIHYLASSMVDMSRSIEQHENSQKALMESFVELIAQAIDDKSPYTAGHCERVPELGIWLADAASGSTDEAFSEFSFKTPDERREFRLAAWLHDCGKITTPEHIVDKGTKLETIYNRIHEVRTRFEVLLRDAKITYYEQLLAHPEQQSVLKQKLEQQTEKLHADFSFIAACNVGGEFMDEAQLSRLHEVASIKWQRHFDASLGLSPLEEMRMADLKNQHLPVEESLLSDKPSDLIPHEKAVEYPESLGINMAIPEYKYNLGEVYNLSVARGTLTAEDRFKINEHVISTIRMLGSVPFPKELAKVPRYASTHHETLKGTGYPRKLTAEQLSIPERVLVLADIFEALTAADRPYKKAKPLSVAIDILAKMVADQHVDEDVFKLFLTSGIYLKYAKRYLNPEQIDDVDIAKYL
ncbi:MULTISPECIES: HD domain-containing phosphohydrolase [unclassified Pseudoalteromonas]|uniref:HD domain-containing phosphohydrolase n=1 Tax=unclassified Pseudoalteromonas TaxID=194690 RepID=UPI002017D230|nr:MULTISPECIES: HD domain-containing phosphohydrolase [unclassified Pseudoalteromonas]